MKILFLVRQLNIGGAERQLVILANELASRGHDIVIASYYPGGVLSKALDNERVRLVCLDKRSRWDLFSLPVKLWKVIRQEEPEIVHGWMHTQNVAATMVRAFRPTTKLVWCVRCANLDPILDNVERALLWMQSRLSKFADCVIVNSLAGLEYAVLGGIPREKMVFIPNGINTKEFYPDHIAGQLVRADWGIGESEKVIGKVARFDPIKNHPLFLKAAARVAAERPDVHFVCVGHGDARYLKELQELTRLLGIENRVRWIQARPDVRAVYNALDIFCSASLSEGFPNVIGEAMSCGCRCVVTDVGDSKQVVGDTGAVVPSNDVEALAAGLLHELDRGGLNLPGRQRILENFTVTHLGDKTEQVLARCLQPGPSRIARALGNAREVRPSADA